MERLGSEEIQLCNTEAGRQAGKVAEHALAVLPKMSKDQIRKLTDAIPQSPLSDDKVKLATMQTSI